MLLCVVMGVDAHGKLWLPRIYITSSQNGIGNIQRYTPGTFNSGFNQIIQRPAHGLLQSAYLWTDARQNADINPTISLNSDPWVDLTSGTSSVSTFTPGPRTIQTGVINRATPWINQPLNEATQSGLIGNVYPWIDSPIAGSELTGIGQNRLIGSAYPWINSPSGQISSIENSEIEPIGSSLPGLSSAESMDVAANTINTPLSNFGSVDSAEFNSQISRNDANLRIDNPTFVASEITSFSSPPLRHLASIDSPEREITGASAETTFTNSFEARENTPGQTYGNDVSSFSGHGRYGVTSNIM